LRAEFDGLLIVIIGLGPVLYWLITNAIHQRRLEHAKYMSKTDDVIIPFLNEISYFTALSPDGRIRFIQRVRFLASNIKFIGRNKLDVTDEMRVKISAALVQISFGYKHYKLFDFNKVNIYPEAFYSGSIKRNVKGLTGRWSVSISWRDFKHGYEVPNDNYNLGLHEMAHALHISSSPKNERVSVFKDHFKHWLEHSAVDFENLQKDRNSSFLRSYGATNSHEFFAVCIEHFFESPSEFKIALPKLYRRTVVLLNQDPLEDRNDYKPNLSAVEQEELKEAFGSHPYKLRHVNMDVTYIMIGLFMAFIVINTITEEAVLNYLDKIIAVLLLSLPAFLLYPRFKREKRFNHLLTFSLFAIFGIGANLFALLLIGNYLLPAKLHMEEHKIINISYIDEGVVFGLEEDVYSRYRDVRTFKTRFKNKPQRIQYTFRKGILGISEVLSRKVISKEE
jgi:MtfA peptidase